MAHEIIVQSAEDISEHDQQLIDEYNDYVANKQFQISEIIAGLAEDPINLARIQAALNNLFGV